VTCAYCNRAIKKADQRDSAYVIGMGHMHRICCATYRANKLDELAREIIAQ